MKLNNIAFCLALSMLCVGFAETALSINAQEFDRLSREGLQHAYAGNYTEALDIFQKLSDAGYTNEAKVGIAKVHYIQKDYNKAAELYKELADAGDSMGQFFLGEMYQLGRGDIKEDLGKAFELYNKSSEQGFHLAKFRLGLMYENGLYVDKDLDEALRLYTEAWIADRSFEPARQAMQRVSFLNMPLFPNWK